MEIVFYKGQVRAVHNFIVRFKAAAQGVKRLSSSNDDNDKALAIEAFVRLLALSEQIKHAANQVGVRFEDLQSKTVEELDAELEVLVPFLLLQLHDDIYEKLQVTLGRCSFEVVDAAYKKALLESRAQIERAFWTLEAIAAMARPAPSERLFAAGAQALNSTRF